MKTSGETLLSLIEEILDFSKIEAGRIDLARAAVRPRSLGRGGRRAARRRARRRKGWRSLPTSTSACRRACVGDAARLRQVLFNLAGNAIKFTEQRRRLASSSSRTRSPTRFAFSVRDTGIGIAPSDQARIFLEFEQADGGSTRKFGGTGLGLTISKRIVESMGGTIAIEEHARSRRYLPRQYSARRASARPTNRACPCPILPATTC